MSNTIHEQHRTLIANAIYAELAMATCMSIEVLERMTDDEYDKLRNNLMQAYDELDAFQKENKEFLNA